MLPVRRIAGCSLSALVATAGLLAAAAPNDTGPDASLTNALCPVVYQLDQYTTARGYHYSFFGNAFFINEQGYLLTVAHVLETFRDGGQPFILVNRPDSPPKLIKVTLVASDPQHDVAILLATPNPFASKYRVSFLPLATGPVVPGQSVLALSLHPARLQDAQSFQSSVEDRSPGEVLSYESTQLDKSTPAGDVFLLSHSVNRGQSGSPVLAQGSSTVVGLVEGRWLRSSAIAPVTKTPGPQVGTPGAAIPIQHAVELLQKAHVSWHAQPALVAPATQQ